jgi:transposase
LYDTNTQSVSAFVVVSASANVSAKLQDYITLVPLPPKSPELNPVENIWQFLRDKWLPTRPR